MIVFEYHYCDLNANKEPCRRGTRKECPMRLINNESITGKADRGIIPHCDHFKIRGGQNVECNHDSDI